MLKAYDIMTQALATCAPEASVAQVAAIMRDRDIGDVLIVKDNQLQGIVTDRDLVLHALTGQADLQQTPIQQYMTTQLFTGEPGWSLEQVAASMARHQIRRLPIVQGGQVLGIVSLGDVARHTDRTEVVANSLHAISAPIGLAAPHRSSSGGPLIGLMLAALVTSVMAWLTWNRSGQTFRKQLSKTDLYHSAQHTLNTARDKVDKAASSKSVRTARRDVDAKIKTVRHDVDATLNDLAAQLPTVTYQPAKAKHGLFA